MEKICKRCGHVIPEGRLSFDIMYEPVSEKKNYDCVAKKVTLCLFCAEAFERFMRNQPTNTVRSGRPKNNSFKSNMGNIRSMNVNIHHDVKANAGRVYIPDGKVNAYVDPEVVKRQEIVQEFNKECK